MSLKKKAKCLVCRLLVALGLKNKKSCQAGPLPTTTVESPKKAKKKTTKKTK